METKTYCGKWYGSDQEIPENARYRLWKGGMVKYFRSEAAANNSFERLPPTQKAVATVENLNNSALEAKMESDDPDELFRGVYIDMI